MVMNPLPLTIVDTWYGVIDKSDLDSKEISGIGVWKLSQSSVCLFDEEAQTTDEATTNVCPGFAEAERATGP